MGITVREAMKIGGLSHCRVAAGEGGLDREIEFITIMEVPDIIQWLKGKDLLLTSLYPIRNDEEKISCLVQQLYENGSAALAIKTHRFVAEIPPVILSEGNRLDFPIIEIAKEVSYLDIMTPLMSSILNKSFTEFNEVEHVLKWITELAMGGKGIGHIIRAVEQLMGNRVSVESEIPFFEGIDLPPGITPLNWSQKRDLKKAKCSIRMTRIWNNKEIPCIVTPIILNNVLYGYVTCWQVKKEFRDIDFYILNRVIPLVALEFLKVKTRLDVEQTYKDDLLSDILFGHWNDQEKLFTKAKWFGWDLSRDYQVIVINAQEWTEPEREDAVTNQEYKREILREIGKMFSTGEEKPILGLRNDLVVVLYPVARRTRNEERHEDRILEVAKAIENRVSKKWKEMKFVIGIGRFYPGIRGIHKSFTEAARAIQLGKRVWSKKTCIHFDQLRIYRMLCEYQDRNELNEMFMETIGKLIEYDKKNRSQLTDTLITYFRCHCSLTETAEKLFVHVNTLKYRLQKIEQLTGCNIQNAEDRLWLHMGAKIYEVFHQDFV
ncbi:PucR family transcriptional regulator [Bacillaceae bacterium]